MGERGQEGKQFPFRVLHVGSTENISFVNFSLVSGIGMYL